MYGRVYTLLQVVDYQFWPRFCGNYRSFTMTIREKMAFILFSSDSNGTAEGFTLACEQVEAGKCLQIINKNKKFGSFNSP